MQDVARKLNSTQAILGLEWGRMRRRLGWRREIDAAFSHEKSAVEGEGRVAKQRNT